MEPEVGSVLEGKVTSIMKFGAFVSLGNGKSGLVHISEVANTFVNDVHDYLQEGQEVKVQVLSTDNGKINLSIKRLLPREVRPAQPRESRPMQQPRFAGNAAPRAPQQNRGNFRPRGVQPSAPASGDLTFEDKLKLFMTASEGKMADLNRNIDGKRSGGRRRK